MLLKGELHHSAADHREEVELLTTGEFDALVIEPHGRSATPRGVGERWYWFCLATWNWLVRGRFYQSRGDLEALARREGLAVYPTRSDDAALWREAAPRARAMLVLVSVGLCWVALAAGGRRAFVAVALALPAITPETLRFLNHPRRNRQMADLLLEANRSHDSVVAIVGDCHTHAIRRHLEKADVSVEYRGPRDDTPLVAVLDWLCARRESDFLGSRDR